jgi:GNAT superfamily N-acetyltransferase
MASQSYSLRQLNGKDDVGSFTCGINEWDTDVADFLKEDAYTQQKMGLNVTWLCLKDSELVGYTSLVASTLRIDKTSPWKTILNIGQIKREYVPCGLIAQFGVARDFQGQGVGSFMLSFIRGAALESEFGIKLLTLHVHDGNIAGRNFWESTGFQVFEPASGNKYKFMVHDLFS